MNRQARTIPAADENLAVPLYHQVYLVLRENIRNGTYPVGGALPTEPELCDAFGVSRITVKRAMRNLAAEGLVLRQRGRGTFAAPALPPARANDALGDLLQNVMAIGAATEMRRIESGMVTPAPDVAAKLCCPPGEKVLRTVQVRMARGEAIAYVTAHVPAAVAAKLGELATSSAPMLAQLQKAGIAVARADQAITATLADPISAPALGIEIGAPLIKLSRLIFDKSERPVEWLVALYRADRYEYRTSLTQEHMGRRSAWQAIEN
jgi:GntR family transcriptional regulator